MTSTPALRLVLLFWLALAASPALAAMDGAVVMPGVSTTRSMLSFLRFSNGDGIAHPVSVMLHHPATGEMLATWTSAPVAPLGTAQVAMVDILAAANPILNPETLPPTLVVVVSGLVGHVQHAAWVAASNTWINATACGMTMMADNMSLPYVTGPGQQAFKGFVRITNGTDAARALALTFTDNAGRASVWQSPAVASTGAVSVSMATIAAEASPAIAADAVSLSVMSEPAPAGMVVGYLEAVSGSTTFNDFSGACMLSVAAPVSHNEPQAGGGSGSSGHSGMSMSTPTKEN